MGAILTTLEQQRSADALRYATREERDRFRQSFPRALPNLVATSDSDPMTTAIVLDRAMGIYTYHHDDSDDETDLEVLGTFRNALAPLYHERTGRSFPSTDRPAADVRRMYDEMVSGLRQSHGDGDQENHLLAVGQLVAVVGSVLSLVSRVLTPTKDGGDSSSVAPDVMDSAAAAAGMDMGTRLGTDAIEVASRTFSATNLHDTAAAAGGRNDDGIVSPLVGAGIDMAQSIVSLVSKTVLETVASTTATTTTVAAMVTEPIDDVVGRNQLPPPDNADVPTNWREAWDLRRGVDNNYDGDIWEIAPLHLHIDVDDPNRAFTQQDERNGKWRWVDRRTGRADDIVMDPVARMAVMRDGTYDGRHGPVHDVILNDRYPLTPDEIDHIYSRYVDVRNKTLRERADEIRFLLRRIVYFGKAVLRTQEMDQEIDSVLHRY